MLLIRTFKIYVDNYNEIPIPNSQKIHVNNHSEIPISNPQKNK